MASSTNGIFVTAGTIRLLILIVSVIGFGLGSAVTGIFMIKDLNKLKNDLKSIEKELN